jgi:FMN phosphatase YigB (HAD superfamily)
VQHVKIPMNPLRRSLENLLPMLSQNVPRKQVKRTWMISCVVTIPWKCISVNYLDNRRFSDVEKTLKKLKSDGKFDLYMFSNGSDITLQNARSTHDVLKTVFASDKIVSVDEVRAYKPSRASYTHLLKVADKMERPQDVILISSNPFDICGSRSMGMRSLWINRTNTSWVDQLGDGPTWIFKSFAELAKFDP